MHKLLGLLAVLSVVSGAPAFATDPPAPTVTPSTPGLQPASAKIADSKGISAQTSNGKILKLVAGDEAAERELARLKSAGYKAELRGEQLVFCRREAQLGSRFEKKVCSSAESLQQQAVSGQDLTNSVQRQGLTANPQGH